MHGIFIESIFPTENGYYCGNKNGINKHLRADFTGTKIWKTQGTGFWIDFLSYFYIGDTVMIYL